jgi:Flp pilus assembly protein TadG
MPVPHRRASGRAGPSRVAHDRGTVTAELAVVLPALVLLALVAVWAVLAVAAHLQCVDAAGVGARALARGEPTDAVSRVVSQIAPPGAEVHLASDGDLVVVEVRAAVRLPGPWAAAAPALQVGDRAVAAAEPPTIAAGGPGP